MIEKYYNIYREEEMGFDEKMTFKKALLFTLFDSLFTRSYKIFQNFKINLDKKLCIREIDL